MIAVETTETGAPPAKVDVLASLTADQRNKWRLTGELPDKDAKTETKESGADTAASEASAPSKPTDAAEVPSSEPDKPPKKQGKPRDDINARLGQLAEQRRLEKERADRLEAEVAELRKGKPAGDLPPPSDTKPPAKAPTYVELVKKYESDPEWPKLDDFVAAGFADPYSAMAAAQAAFVQDRRLTERDQAAAFQTRQQRMNERIDTAYAKASEDPEFDRANLAFDVPASFAETLFESDLSAELLKYFSKHPSEGRTLAAMEPLAAARAIGKLESQLSTSPPSRVATKTTSDAPPPPLTLGARHTPGAVDEAEEAVKSKDFSRYRAIMNKRELAGTR